MSRDSNLPVLHITDAEYLRLLLAESNTRNKNLSDENEEIKSKRFFNFNSEECWCWDAAGENYLESLVCPVVISADDMRDIHKRLDEVDLLKAQIKELELQVVDAAGDCFYDGYCQGVNEAESISSCSHDAMEERALRQSEQYESNHRYSKSMADIRAKAVMGFAETVKGAYLAGFVSPNLTVYDVFQSARNHTRDNYRYESDPWVGEEAEKAKHSEELTAKVEALTKFIKEQAIPNLLVLSNDYPQCLGINSAITDANDLIGKRNSKQRQANHDAMINSIIESTGGEI